VRDNDGLAGDVLRLTVNVKDIADMPESAPLGQGTDRALPNMAALARGEFGNAADFSLKESERVRAVGAVNAQDFVILARFEVCDVTFQRVLRFFRNDRQVTVTLYGPVSTIQEEESQYFTKDARNCGDESIWNFDKQSDFYTALTTGTAGPIAQEWFDTFDKIAQEIEFF